MNEMKLYKKKLQNESKTDKNAENELDARDMIDSCFVYGENIYTSISMWDHKSYADKYIEALGKNKFDEIYNDEMDYLSECKINANVVIDSEGVSYNSTSEPENYIRLLNPADKDYYDNKKFIVSLPAGNFSKDYKVFADDEETALELVVVDLEKNSPAFLMTDDDFLDNEDYKNDCIYVDATSFGADKPYYLDGTTTVKEYNLSKNMEIGE